MSGEPPLQPALVCQKCGAVNPPHATGCWVCEGRGANPYASPPTLQPQDPQSSTLPLVGQTNARVESVFAFLLILLAVLTILVGIGLATQDPGVLVLYLIVVVPTFLAVGTRALYSVAKGERPRASSLFMVFVWSGVITAAIFSLLVVAAFISIFVMCLQLVGGPR